MNELGNIKIADDVVKTISAKAAQDVSGVYKLAGGYRGRQKRKSGNAGGEANTDIIHGEGTAQSQRLRESQSPMFGKFFLLPA